MEVAENLFFMEDCAVFFVKFSAVRHKMEAISLLSLRMPQTILVTMFKQVQLLPRLDFASKNQNL